MKNSEIKELWEKRVCPSYTGGEPYVFLSFAPFDMKEGLAILSILNDLGCHVRYDEKMLTGRPWTSEICEAIEGCSVFFEVYAPEYHFSLTKELSDEFAGRLKKKHVNVFLYDRIPEEPSRYPTLISTTVDDPSLPERCRLGLEDAGYFTAVPEDPSPEKYDLMLDYYRTIKDWEEKFRTESQGSTVDT